MLLPECGRSGSPRSHRLKLYKFTESHSVHRGTNIRSYSAFMRAARSEFSSGVSLRGGGHDVGSPSHLRATAQHTRLGGAWGEPRLVSPPRIFPCSPFPR